MDPAPTAQAPLHVIKVRRDYNSWVARETLEDYALRFTPHGFRKWSEWRVAHTAFGGAAAFLVLEALGGTLLLQYGFVNTLWAIVATALIVLAAGLPISAYAAKHGLDMDLLTRGAGFGYIGSTVTSLIYASFTFIFFALEAAIMAYALELAFGIPPAWGYALCAFVVIPLAAHGVTTLSRFQAWTMPLWLLLLVLPFVVVFLHHPTLASELVHYPGLDGGGGSFDPLLFGAALTVGVALITQMGEQVDYLRFMPARTPANRMRWWAAVVVGGPGWVVPGVLKMLGGALLALLALKMAVPPERAVDPNQMYLAAYELLFAQHGWAVAATALFVVISQLKINVTNAYAGSLAWSNFFARVSHSHPGRVVWMVFNLLIALMLMELQVFQAIAGVLSVYSNIAISWIMAVVADLVVNKPLGLSPRGVEFRRARLFDINPVGVGAMGLASVVSMAAWAGAFGPMAQAFSAVIAMAVAFVSAPLIAWATRGRFYLVPATAGVPADAAPEAAAEADGGYLGARMRRCVLCEREYEGPDMAACPAYRGPICSLCCALDTRCGDACRPAAARVGTQLGALLRALTPRRWHAALQSRLDQSLLRWLLLMAAITPALAAVLALVWHAEARLAPELAQALQPAFIKAGAALLLVASVIAWWLVLAQTARRVAQEESRRQTEALQREIASHRETDAALQRAKQAADAASQAKSRYVSAISHELRTPLNSILGYAQLLDEDPALPAERRQAVAVIRRGGEHLLSLIEGTLDIARIESGRLQLEPRAVELPRVLAEVAQMFELQALAKGLAFRHQMQGLPRWVRADERRLVQILINLLGNAVKFTERGGISLRVTHQCEVATFEIEDSGPGIAAGRLERIFEPYERGAAAERGAPAGTGLGLTIARMLAELMGGELTARSEPGQGSCFRLRLFLPDLGETPAAAAAGVRRAYAGRRRRLLVVDNEEVDRTLLVRRLSERGFDVDSAASGAAALEQARAASFDAMLLDLAMPGLDGWQTLARLHEAGLGALPVAIVSANAFDRGQDNRFGITAADFITKPVRWTELLDWLTHRLALEWLAQPAGTAPADAAAVHGGAPAQPGQAPSLPSRAELEALREAVRLGYPRGIREGLARIEAASPGCASWIAPLAALADAFRFDPMLPLIDAAIQRRSQESTR